MRTLFDYPTIKALSETIDTLLWANPGSNPVQSDQPDDREEFEL